MPDLVVIGCGGFGREVIGLIDAINSAAAPGPIWNLLGCIDDNPSAENLSRLKVIGVRYLGTTEQVRLGPIFDEAFVVIAVGLPLVRWSIAKSLGRDFRVATLIDPAARLGRDVRVGAGSVVCAGAQITTNVSIGDHVHVDRGVQIGHDSTLEDFVTVHPAAVISGGCTLRRAARVGTSATILPGRSVGSEATVGAAACVTRDVEPFVTVAGVPARTVPARPPRP